MVRAAAATSAISASASRSEEHTSELQSQSNLVCRLLLEKKKTTPDARAIHRLPSPLPITDTSFITYSILSAITKPQQNAQNTLTIANNLSQLAPYTFLA